MNSIISIIIIVKGDRRIGNVLSTLEKIQKPHKTEIIVVDASAGSLNDIKKKFSLVHWIKFKSKTNKKITIPEQRNVGVKSAKGSIIVFIDSDCIPERLWLSHLVAPIFNGSEYIVAGKVNVRNCNSIHTIAKKHDINKKYIDESPTMNIAISKGVYKKVGYYDESFQFGSDVDFAWRARRAGYKIRAISTAVIYHDVGDTRNEIRRMYVYGRARTKLYRKNTYRLKYFMGNELLTILYPLYFLFLPLTLVFPFYLLLILIPVIRYAHNNPVMMILMKTAYGVGVLKGLILPD